MKLFDSSILFIFTAIFLPGEAYRILGVFPTNTKSHFVMFGQLMKGLAERGHQVDVISHYPLKKPFPNYTDVVNLAGTQPTFTNNMTVEMISEFEKGGSSTYLILSVFGTCEAMGYPEMKQLLENPPKNPAYDLVIVEVFGASGYLALGHHFKVPVVGLASTTMFPWANDHVANPDNSAYIPNPFAKVDDKMNFWQRLTNTLINVKSKWEFKYYSASQNQELKKYLGPKALTVAEAERNVSLILVNSHFSLNGPRPFTTAVVEVGGLHIDERGAKLSKDLQKWLDDSEHGCVYISFGSMIKIESLPDESLAALYTSMAKLAPVRVLMKVAEPKELPPGLPSNVLTHPWIPQLAVLMHKNTRAFMTHGGLMGTQEAIYCGVPMIGVPFFGDQGQNIRRYAQLNFAVALDYKEFTVDRLDAAFNAVLHDPSYMKAAKKMSAQFRDRPMSAMDTAVFWLEYVIRNGGTNLRSPAMDLTWWQIELFDVYGFLLLSIALAVCLIIASIKKVIRAILPASKKSTKESKKVK